MLAMSWKMQPHINQLKYELENAFSSYFIENDVETARKL